MDSSRALFINNIPKNILIIGGGIIGMEMSCFYHALGSKITVVEISNNLFNKKT